MAKAVMAMAKRVLCHPWIVYDGKFKAIKPWSCWVVAKAVVAMAACHPMTHIHP